MCFLAAAAENGRIVVTPLIRERGSADGADEQGNVAIAGHRTTYGKPFANVDRLKAGDVVVLETPIGACTYTVSRAPFIVAPDDFSVIDPTRDRELTLTSCHPKGSAAHRIIIRAVFAHDGGA